MSPPCARRAPGRGVSVTERVREIGLRKALGAPPRIIRRQFLVESSLLGLLGGIAGTLLGLLGAWLLPGTIGQPITASPPAAAVAITLAVGDQLSARSTSENIVISGHGGVQAVVDVPVGAMAGVTPGQRATVIPDGSDSPPGSRSCSPTSPRHCRPAPTCAAWSVAAVEAIAEAAVAAAAADTEL